MPAPTSSTMLGRLYEAVPRFLQPVEFKVVETAEELRAASRLVYTEYLKRGYVLENPTGMKLSLYHLLPETTTFIAVHRRAGVIGTISLAVDSPLGLPMDDGYKYEVDALRRQGLRLAEATMLALDSQLFGSKVFTLFHPKKLLLTLRLFKIMFDYLRSSTEAHELVACFNPKHQTLYDFLQLAPLGGLKTYTGANGKPSVARHLNIENTRKLATGHVAYRLYYGAQPSPKPFAKKLRFTSEDLRQLFVLETPLLAAASPTELAHVLRCYPTFDFSKILGKPLPSDTPKILY